MTCPFVPNLLEGEELRWRVEAKFVWESIVRASGGGWKGVINGAPFQSHALPRKHKRRISRMQKRRGWAT